MIDYFLFLFLLRKKLFITDIWFLLSTFIIIFIIDGLGYIGAYFSPLLEAFLLYLYYKKKTPKYLLISALLLVSLNSILIDFCTYVIGNFFSISINYQILISITLYFSSFIILRIYNPIQYFQNDKSSINLWILFYLFITLNIAGFIIITIPSFTPSFIAIFCLLILQCIFTIFIYKANKQIQQKKLNLQEKKDLLFLIQNLEESQSRLRRFKHDYQNLLNSLKLSALSGNNLELLEKLEKYSKERLGKDSLWQFQDTKNIKNDVLRSIFISKLNSIYQKDIKYKFECVNKVTKLPKIDLFDLTRIIGIAYDNAIEECEQLKKGGINNVYIYSMLYQPTPRKLEFEIKNSCNPNIDIGNITAEGVSNKVNHHGLGLATVQKTIAKYNNAFTSYSIEDESFTLIISFE